MDQSIVVTNILENTCLRHTLLAQHGQSIHLNYFGNQYLFDVGEVFTGLKHNLDQMRLDLAAIKGIVISHRHIDHAGALKELLPLLTHQKLLITDDYGVSDLRAYSEKYRFAHMEPDGKFNVAVSQNEVDAILGYQNTEIVSATKEIEPNLFSTGPLGEQMREQALVIKTIRGIVVVVGCSHPTLPVIIKKAQEITKTEKVYGIMGGFHFKDSNKEEFSEYIGYLKDLNPEFLAPGHCTGFEAIVEMQKILGPRVKVAGTGSFGTGNSVEILPELKFNFV
jgi:7,8-dihydropterin-6-yl-methyl-4-(beta-D-ribofuranosyl)aminobenzene 5'-phosphate synthase